MPNSPNSARPLTAANQDLAARLAATRAVANNAAKLPDGMMVPPGMVPGQSPRSPKSDVPYRDAFTPSSAQRSPHTNRTLESDSDLQIVPALDRPPQIYVNEAVGRERLRKAAQAHCEFPAYPFLKNVEDASSLGNGLKMPASPGPSPPAFPRDTKKPPQALPALSDSFGAGEMSPFGVYQAWAAKTLPKEVMDAKPATEETDPFDSLIEQAISVHKEQVKALVSENEELKDKLNAVLAANWTQSGDGAHGKFESIPLHLTSEAPGCLGDAWLWTLSEKDHAKQLAKRQTHFDAFAIREGWLDWDDFAEEAQELLVHGIADSREPEAVKILKDVTAAARQPCMVLMTRPDSNKRLVWDVCGMILLLYDIVMIPIGAFEPEESTFFEIIDWVTVSFWTLDILYNFLTGYVDRGGTTVMHPGRVALNYLSAWFWVDALVVIPDWAFTILDKAGGGGAAADGQWTGLLRVLRAIRVARLLRLAKLRRFMNMAKDRITSESVFLMVFVLQLFTLLACCNHFLGALWYLIGNSAKNSGDGNNWIAHSGIDSKPLLHRYLAAYQWSMSNFALGSVMIYPRNSSERAFGVVVLVFGLLMFSLVTAGITSSMMRISRMHRDTDNQFWLLRRYLRQHGLQNSLASRILRYLEYKIASTKELIHEDQVPLLNELPEALTRELKCAITFGPLLLGHPLFVKASVVSQSALYHLADDALRFKHFSAEDGIFVRGSTATCLLWVTEGQFLYRRGRVEDKVEVEDCVCEGVLWTWWTTKGTLRAKEDSSVITLDTKSFVEVLGRNELMLSFMSAYAAGYVAWLNSQDPDELSDVTWGGKDGHRQLHYLLDQIPKWANENLANAQETKSKLAEKPARRNNQNGHEFRLEDY